MMQGSFPSPGQRAVARCDALAVAPFSQAAEYLDRPYLSGAHRAALDQTAVWMQEAGMAVRIDPLGNLVGRYEGAQKGAKTLLMGSHIDTVHDGGPYDGALGVMIGIECADALYRAGRRAPFALEVIAFGDEEGSRFPAAMMCSRGMSEAVGQEALNMVELAGTTLAEAMSAFGLNPEALANAVRAPNDILAFVEAHIEQGPVLETQGLPVCVVSGIAAQKRLRARFIGHAGHAGTAPMTLRRDAIAGAAAAILAVEDVCVHGSPDLRGTVGRVLPATAAYNVIAGEAEIGVDVRAATEAARDEAVRAIGARFETIASARGLGLDFTVIQDLPATRCDPVLMKVMGDAVAGQGLPLLETLSGAGHDAAVMAKLAPIVMLFIRCEGGISHNPLESVADDDVDVAVRVLGDFIERLALEAA